MGPKGKKLCRAQYTRGEKEGRICRGGCRCREGVECLWVEEEDDDEVRRSFKGQAGDVKEEEGC